MRRHLPRGTLQQDNARPHTPDINPIENIWSDLGRSVRERNPAPANVAELRAALINAWNGILHAKLRAVIQSIRRRCLACIATQGGHTKY